MLLGNYFTNIDSSKKKIFFSGISFNSKDIKKDNIFFAIKGNNFDGNKFISIAIKKGSKIIISEKRITNPQKDILFIHTCLLYTSPSPRDATLSRMPSSA